MDSNNQLHLKAHKTIIEESNRQSDRLLLLVILDEIITIRKVLGKANKPKRKKK